ncbi:MAG: hypothetical protein GC189_05880 [Alphaproteobacteria bacterium]|nr:hypothetical protein [Alphaproteobacteria bacterium]
MTLKERLRVFRRWRTWATLPTAHVIACGALWFLMQFTKPFLADSEAAAPYVFPPRWSKAFAWTQDFDWALGEFYLGIIIMAVPALALIAIAAVFSIRGPALFKGVSAACAVMEIWRGVTVMASTTVTANMGWLCAVLIGLSALAVWGLALWRFGWRRIRDAATPPAQSAPL